MIYLDHAAMSPVHPQVLDRMLPWLQQDHVGNPSSIHTQGVLAHKAIEEARVQVARLIHAQPSEVYFTSGGTESNNALFRSLMKPVVITTPVEHHSALDSIPKIGKPVFAKVDGCGVVDMKDLEAKIQQYRAVLGAVSVMWVNNELGTINPVQEIGELCKWHGVPFYVDAVQAVGHIPVDVSVCQMDMMSISGHKFGAPPGVGALYIRNGKLRNPLLYGGGQEAGFRAGTENVSGIVALGAAAQLAMQELPVWQNTWKELRRVFLDALAESMKPYVYGINGGDHVAPHIINVTIPGVHGESLVLRLDQVGICVSAGAACSAGSPIPSHVLRAIGLSDELAAATIRISTGWDTTAEEMKTAARAISEAVKHMRSTNHLS